jgi:hypothetical protein
MEERMSDKMLYRIAGASAILGTLLILVANLGGMFMETAPGLGSMIPEESLSAVAATPDPVLLSAWLNIYGALLIAVAVVGIYYLMRRVGGHAVVPLVVMEFGVVFLTASYLLSLAGAYQLGPLYAQGVSREALYGAEYLRKIVFETSVTYGSWLTLGVSMALFGVFGLRSSAVPKWISWVAIVGGIVGMEEWLKAYPWQADRTPLVFANLTAFAVWGIAMGIVMLKNRRESEL